MTEGALFFLSQSQGNFIFSNFQRKVVFTVYRMCVFERSKQKPSGRRVSYPERNIVVVYCPQVVNDITFPLLVLGGSWHVHQPPLCLLITELSDY